eukprot:3617689-Prymnesium_polylepis.1
MVVAEATVAVLLSILPFESVDCRITGDDRRHLQAGELNNQRLHVGEVFGAATVVPGANVKHEQVSSASGGDGVQLCRVVPPHPVELEALTGPGEVPHIAHRHAEELTGQRLSPGWQPGNPGLKPESQR